MPIHAASSSHVPKAGAARCLPHLELLLELPWVPFSPSFSSAALREVPYKAKGFRFPQLAAATSVRARLQSRELGDAQGNRSDSRSIALALQQGGRLSG